VSAPGVGPFADSLEIERTIRVPRRKRIAREGGGFTWVDDGEDVVEVVVTISATALARSLGAQAWGNKSKRAVEAHGLVVAHAKPGGGGR
jgi:hypothetical protein